MPGCCDAGKQKLRVLHASNNECPLKKAHGLEQLLRPTLVPTRAFTSVDLPALGTPTTPACNSRCWSAGTSLSAHGRFASPPTGAPAAASCCDSASAAARRAARPASGSTSVDSGCAPDGRLQAPSSGRKARRETRVVQRCNSIACKLARYNWKNVRNPEFEFGLRGAVLYLLLEGVARQA